MSDRPVGARQPTRGEGESDGSSPSPCRAIRARFWRGSVGAHWGGSPVPLRKEHTDVL